jgi:RNA ligase
MPFDELVAGLVTARDNRHVYQRQGPGSLTLYIYSEHCVFDAAWTRITIAARGLILCHDERRIIATPFPKFFNLGEHGLSALENAAFDATEKLDGSLIIIYHHGGRWRTATKGAFDSAQAKWAEPWLTDRVTAHFKPGTTYLAEATYPENRIVVKHETGQLRLLAACMKEEALG